MRAKTMVALTAALAAWGMSVPGARAAIYTGGSGASYSMGAMTSDVLLGPAVTLSSAADQAFLRGYAPVAISTITITDDPSTPVIKIGTLSVWIPAGFAMTWDETDTMPTFGGTAAGKVNPTVSYTGSNQRLRITVTADFSAGQTLTISALSFKNYIGLESTRLQLDYDNDGIADAQDDKTITIFGFYSYGGFGADYAMDQMLLDRELMLSGAIFKFH